MESEISAEFTTNIESVWEAVTNNSDYSWRSDIDRVELLDRGDAFIEYNKKNIKTTCYITKKVKYEVYEFNIENENLYGNFKGSFYKTEDGGTKVILKEDLFVRNPIKRIFAKFFMNLEKIQNTYINDLKRKLGEN